MLNFLSLIKIIEFFLNHQSKKSYLLKKISIFSYVNLNMFDVKILILKSN